MPDGVCRTLVTLKTPVRNRAGAIVRIVTVSMDVTARVRLVDGAGMTGQLPDPTVDPDAELDLPPPLPARITGLLVSLGATALGLVAAEAVPFLGRRVALAGPAVRPDAECGPGGHRLAAVAARRAPALAGGRVRLRGRTHPGGGPYRQHHRHDSFAGRVTVLSAGRTTHR